MFIMLPGTTYSFGEIAGIVVRRRWFVLLPFAGGLSATSLTESSVTSIAGPLAGLLLGVVLIAVLEYRDSSFSREEDAARVLMLPVLGMVPIVSELERRSRSRRGAALGAIAYVVVLSALGLLVWGWLT
jgi:hypothetical protein